MLEKIVNKISKGLKLVLGGALLAGVSSLAVLKAEASIVENLQTSTQPIITKLDYRGDVSSLDSIGTRSLAIAQSFIALDNYIIDGSLKLSLHPTYYHNMYLKIWPDDNGIPDIANEIGNTTNELTPRGDPSFDYDYYLSEFGFSAIQVTLGERYWLGLYNPDLNPYGFSAWSIYGNPNPYPNGYYGLKGRVDMPWTIYDSEGRDLAFSVIFSNIPEPYLSTLLGLGIFGLALNKKLKIKKG